MYSKRQSYGSRCVSRRRRGPIKRGDISEYVHIGQSRGHPANSHRPVSANVATRSTRLGPNALYGLLHEDDRSPAELAATNLKVAAARIERTGSDLLFCCVEEEHSEAEVACALL